MNRKNRIFVRKNGKGKFFIFKTYIFSVLISFGKFAVFDYNS